MNRDNNFAFTLKVQDTQVTLPLSEIIKAIICASKSKIVPRISPLWEHNANQIIKRYVDKNEFENSLFFKGEIDNIECDYNGDCYVFKFYNEFIDLDLGLDTILECVYFSQKKHLLDDFEGNFWQMVIDVYRCEYLITDESDFLSQTNSRFPWVQEKPDSETHIPKKH